MIRCPKCNYFKVATERRPGGNSKCIACQYEAPTKEFEVKNWYWIDRETQTQLDKLKSLMSVQLDMLEQNKQMSDEISDLKSKLKMAKNALQLIADDASKPIEQISGYFIGEETLDQVEQVLKEIES